MKIIFAVLIAVLLTSSIFAQSPEKISYQEVIRNSSNALVTHTQIGMQISILQGSAIGAAVYVETQKPTSNANGLVSIEIGAGNVDSGDFTTIDWANGPFFIKTETDPTGGSNYTISGTSQLLSVPYALYAKTAESITGGGNHYIGELYGGGVVFWVDHTGQHGLIVSMVDQGKIRWTNVDRIEIGETAISDWDGMGNTIAIIGHSGYTSGAAKLCYDYTNADYGTGTYSDWYLPARAELNHIGNNFYEVHEAIINDGNFYTTAFVRNRYWSSTESPGTGMVDCFYFDDNKAGSCPKDFICYVRAVRAF